MRPGVKRGLHALFGSHPWHLGYIVAPTGLAVALDFAIRARALLVYPPFEWLNYTGSTLASAGFWGAPVWLLARLFAKGTRAARVGVGLVLGLVVLPLAVFCYGGQLLYFRVVGAYMARDTVRVGIALRGTLGEWLTAWGGPWIFLALLACAIPFTVAIAWSARRARASLVGTWPVLPTLGFVAASICFWTDFVESRSLQAAPPDTCFLHGVYHAIREASAGQSHVRHGFTLRTPAPLPAIPTPAHRPNVLLVLTESVRADAVCSAPSPGCKDAWLDEVVPDRVPLGTLVTQSPGTFSACMMLWTGLPPTADLKTVHEAPVLWEVAKATGYRTAYVTSQNLRYDDFGAFVERAGIDVLVSALELGDTKNAQMGAPDESATREMLRFVEGVPEGQPWFGVLHFSNTHSPYRTDPALQPFTPHADDPTGSVLAFHNQYRNSVALQERTLQAFLKALRARPSWDDTVVVFLSDHGEAFREHGRLYHINTLYEEEVRIPGWIAAGPRALGATQRRGLRSYAGHRAFSQDVNATVVDLLGAHEAHAGFPFADRTNGRSLLRTVTPFTALLATQTAVWEPAVEASYGAMNDTRVLMGSKTESWRCFDLTEDPEEQNPLEEKACGALEGLAERAFPRAKR